MSYDISMKKLIILFFALIFNQCVFALDVVYPKKNCVTINSPTTFFVGSSKESLNINGKNVELHNTGAFAHFVELSYGENIFEIKTKDESLTYVITRPYSKSKSYAKPEFVEIDDFVGVVNTDKTPLRSTPVNAGINRIVHLQKGVKLKIDGELSSFYRVVLSEGEKAWVSKTNVNLVKDKTQLEGYENHFHLFGKIRKRYQKKVEVVTNLILQNLIKELRQNFPNKKFRVYLDCDFSDHVIIRFHQYWEDEHPYYNPDEFPSITEFKIE